MKIRLVLVVFLFVSLLANGQTDVIFYSKGKMHVQYPDGKFQGSDSLNTTLHIVGSAKFVTGSVIDQKGRTQITGDFINAKNPLATAAEDPIPHLFTPPGGNNTYNDGVVAFVAKGTKQLIYGVKDEAIPNPIKIDALPAADPWRLQKEKNYIHFPSIHVEKGGTAAIDPNGDWRKLGFLEVEPSAAVRVDFLDASSTDRFSVLANTDVNNPGAIVSGHAFIWQLHSALEGTKVKEASYSQVRLDYYKQTGEGIANDDGYFDTSGSVPVAAMNGTQNSLRTKDGSGKIWNYLTGFTPPFHEMGADYMFYNVLTKPAATSITSWEGPIVDPFFKMQGGRGYFMSMEVSHADHDHIDKRWDFEGDGAATGIHSSKRARGGYTFNRMTFHNFLSDPAKAGGANASAGSMGKISRFLYKYTDFAANDAYGGGSGIAVGGLGGSWIENGKDRSRYELMEDERFVIAGVNITLTAGLNFLGNPFTAPISLNPLLGYDFLGNDTAGAAADDGYEVDFLTPFNAPDIKASASSTLGVDLRAKYWVMNQAKVRYEPSDNLFHYQTAYDYVSREAGATAGTNIAGADPLTYRIAPMQMFCLQAARPVTIYLSPQLRVLEGAPTNFLKNGSLKSATDNSFVRNWFVVEAVNDDNTTDRTSIVFNDKAITQYKDDPYDTRKGLTLNTEEIVDKFSNRATAVNSEYLSYTTGLIYTKSSDGEKLLGNAIPTKTKEVALFYEPTGIAGEVTLRFYGLENLESVPNVWLVDKQLNNKTVKLEPGSEYTFVSDPVNNASSVENRFLLRFLDDPSTLPEIQKEEVTGYYNSSASTLNITGLTNEDVNSDLLIYDLQGRTIGKFRITKTDSESFMRPLSLGTYIVKIAGKRNHTIKIASLQN